MTDSVTEFRTPPHTISPAETGARGELSMAALEQRIILAATAHADTLGIGFRNLIEKGKVWVLSRMSIEMSRPLRMHETFSIATWIETVNRSLSERNFAIIDSHGNEMGYARSMWACIDIESRHPALIEFDPCAVSGRSCPIARQPRMKPVSNPERVVDYRFTYSDIDFNRHVNSARYVELIANCFTMDWHDSHAIERLDIAYLREAAYGTDAEVRIASDCADPMQFSIDIVSGGGDTRHCSAKLRFRPSVEMAIYHQNETPAE